ncbi:MAG: hypothetical protein F4013_07865 [Gammaproteobacteria bacterium]|nr:hypothetical protein [Gammaproteobacteria bacterium]MYL01598.1 hypothetical protein [Gammaproteobacteria bacterium]
MTRNKMKWVAFTSAIGGAAMGVFALVRWLDWFWASVVVLLAIASTIPAILVLELAKRNKLFPER